MVSELARIPEDSQEPDGWQCGNVVIADDIKQRCVGVLKKFAYDRAPEVLVKIIILAVWELSTIEGINKVERFER